MRGMGARRGRLAARLLVGVLTCAALAFGATGTLAATTETHYDAVPVESPNPGFNSRFAERLTTGDATGDGVTDVFASSWVQDLSASEAGTAEDVPQAGTVSMINGATQQIEWWTASPDVQPRGRFGFFISGVGDVNGDGRDDVVAGASGQNVDGNESQGRGYVLSGVDGSLIHRLDNPHPQANAGFASRIGSAGDVTGDGVGDILAGAPANDIPAGCGNVPRGTPVPDNCRVNEGEVFVFNGRTGEHESTINLPPEDVVGPPCTSSCGSFGSNPQNIGDLTQDGIPDFHLPAISYRATPEHMGRIYIYDGATNEVLIRIDQPQPDPNGFFGLGDLDRGGLGDLNADGYPELYGTGFLQDGPNGEESAGRAWVFDGYQSLRQGRGVLLYDLRDPHLAPARAFGWAASRTDYNRDGRPDIYTSGLQNRLTETWIYDGTNGKLLKTLALPPQYAQSEQPGNSASALGWSSRALGDVNGDGEPDYAAGAPYQDVKGTQDQGRVFFFLSNLSAPPAPPAPAPPAVGQCGSPGAAGYLNPAKLRVSRARVLREGRRLDVLAPITSLADGEVAVEFHADGRRDTFTAGVTEANTALDEIRIMEPITRGQAELGTGIVNLEYQGDADTRPEFVRLRAAPGRAGLAVEEISLIGDRLSAQGSVTSRAEGVVRLRYSYVDPDGSPNVHEARAEIQDNGDWKLENDQVPAQLAQCGGYLSIQFTGYFPRLIRGEQLAYELNAGQTRRP